MKTIKLWRVDNPTSTAPDVIALTGVSKTETERLLEDILVANPALLTDDLTVVGRQTETPGGPLDLLGIDGDGKFAVFELKRGTLTREAVAQIIDYGSFLSTLNAEELGTHISQRSGNHGIDRIEDFFGWYQEQFAKPLEDYPRPRLVLVGLGADERTRRMVEYLSTGEFDVSLITFHAFESEGALLLARQVEVEAPTRPPSDTKERNLEKLRERASKLGISSFYFDVARFFREQLHGYEWPNPSGFSYYLPELTESGTQTNRAYIALTFHETKPGRVLIRLYERAVAAAAMASSDLPQCYHEIFELKPNGTAEAWLKSASQWQEAQGCMKAVCEVVSEGWKRRSDAATAAASGESLPADE